MDRIGKIRENELGKMSSQLHTILLVEDDAFDVRLLKRAFQRANIAHHLQTVGDGDAAIDYLTGHNEYADREKHPLPSLILLDLKLPRKSGHEVLAWLRGQPVLRRIPVVVLTSSPELADVNRAYDSGTNCYFVKPLAFDDLVAVVKTLESHWLVLNELPEVQ